MTNNNSKKIAVVAVHGVSDQKPFESARAIANLLLDPTTNKKANYTPFYERFFRVVVRPLKIKDKNKNPNDFIKSLIDEKLLSKHWWLSFFPDERGVYTRRRIKTPFKQLQENDFDDVDLDFTRDRLKKYDTSTVYDTICLEGERTTSNGRAKKVHIYEMHWADLSRLGTGLFQIFGGLFQLLFHLSSLGRPIVDSTRIKIRENRDLCDECLDNRLKWWGRFQIWTGLTLSLLISNLNLYLLIAALLSLPVSLLEKQPEQNLYFIPPIIGIILAVLTARLVMYQSKISAKIAPKLPVLIFIGSTLLLYGLNRLIEPANWLYYSLITIIWCVLLIFVYWVVLIKPLDRHRPGTKGFAKVIGIFLVACTLILFVLFLQQEAYKTPEILTSISLNLIEIIYFILCFAWLCFNLLYLITAICWFISFINFQKRVNQASEEKYTARKKQVLLKNFRQVFLTTQLSLVLPAVLFLFFTLIFWRILADTSSSLLLETKFYQTSIFPFTTQTPIFISKSFETIFTFTSLEFFKSTPTFHSELFESIRTFEFFKDYSLEPFQKIFAPSEFLDRLMLFAHSPIADIISWVFIIVLSIVLYSFLPAIWSDIKPSKAAADENYSEKLGTWLTKGFSVMTIIIFVSLLIAPVLGLFSNILNIANIFSIPIISDLFNSGDSSDPLTFRIAFVVVTASATSLIALGNRLNKISSNLWIVLDTILDVDNYFRLHPQDDTPRARIFARYVSLLRYLYRWKDPQDDQPYDAIIIVSHSQGTVITADLLRLLSVDSDDSLEQSGHKPPIYIFTMGSPLKQLYGFAFPDLYDWISNPEKLSNQILNVKEWVNAYRSGDYIGRYIWASPKDENLYIFQKNRSKRMKPKSINPILTREYCIGAGGHTHYWNTNAPEIAKEIDCLIGKSKY